MPSDVLSALLGVLAGGAGSYIDTKETRRKEKLAAGESAAERASRKELQGAEIASREKEGAANRLTEKDLTTMKLQAERDNLDKELKANLDRAKMADSTEREKIKVDRERIISEMDRLDKELNFRNKELATQTGLKNRELDIEQGKAGLGGKLAGASGTNPLLGYLPEITKAYVSARGPDMKPEELIGFLKTLNNYNFGPDVASPSGGTGGDKFSPLGRYPQSGLRNPSKPVNAYSEIFHGLRYLMDPIGTITRDSESQYPVGSAPPVPRDILSSPRIAPVQVQPDFSGAAQPTSQLPGELNFGSQGGNPSLGPLAYNPFAGNELGPLITRNPALEAQSSSPNLSLEAIINAAYNPYGPLVTRSKYIRKQRGEGIRTLK